MGILDSLKNQVEKLGDKARGGFDDVKDKAGDLLDDAKDRLGHDDETSPLAESSDVGADSSSTDAVQPGYVTAEDDVSEESDESSLEAAAELDADDDPDAIEGAPDPVMEEEVFVTEPAASSDVVAPAAAELDPVEIDAVELDAEELDAEEADEPVSSMVPGRQTDASEPVVETDVDPYEQPLTESIGDEIAAALVDREAVTEAVAEAEADEPERDAQA